ASHVPGGLGVIEAVVLEMVPFDKAELMGTLVAFRAIYYLLPLAVAISLLGGHELFAHQQRVRSLVDRLGRWAPQLAPRLLAFACFIAGVLLLFSGATPVARSRLDWLEGYVSIGLLKAILEGSHFLRKSSLLADRFSPQWTVAVLLVMVCTVALAVFAYKRQEYRHDLWWEFELQANAPRTLRALTGATVAIFIITVAHLLQAKHKPPGAPSQEDVLEAMTIARSWPRTYAQLVALGDKSTLFSEDRTG